MDLIRFKGWEDTFALFEVHKGLMPNNQMIDKIRISHEGNWIDEDAMICHPKYDKYEDVQKELGKGLWFLRKWYSPQERKSNFEFKVLNNESILAVPATGEEIDFEIYGLGPARQETLLLKREL